MVLSKKDYPERTADPRGNFEDRGLEAIFEEIREKYLYSEEDSVEEASDSGEYVTAALAAQSKSED